MKYIFFTLALFTATLIAAEGQSNMQEVNAKGVTFVVAYKAPAGETQEKKPFVVDISTETIQFVLNNPAPVTSCGVPEYGTEFPFPLTMVKLKNAFTPIRGKASWLPPHPGKKGKETIEGIDADGDCVRDDIEHFIAERYPDSSQKNGRKHLFEYAIYLGLFLKNGITQHEAKSYSTRMYLATECARRELGDTPDTTKNLDKIFAKFHNTLDRSYRYIANSNLLSGTTSEVPNEIICLSTP